MLGVHRLNAVWHFARADALHMRMPLPLPLRSQGLADLGADDDIMLREHSSSDHGGNLYRLHAGGSGGSTHGGTAAAAGQEASFKLFGEIEALPLTMSGAIDAMAAQAAAGGGRQPAKSFRLFGDLEPLPLSSGDSMDVSAAAQAGADGTGPAEAQPEQSFRLFDDVEPLQLRWVGSGGAGVSACLRLLGPCVQPATACAAGSHATLPAPSFLPAVQAWRGTTAAASIMLSPTKQRLANWLQTKPRSPSASLVP